MSRSSRGWWLIVALVVGPAAILAGLSLRALRVERVEREQELWRQQSRLLLLVDRAVSPTFTVLERDLDQAGARLSEASPMGEERESARCTRLAFDRQQVLVFPDDRVYFAEFGRRPAAGGVPPPASPELLEVTEQARTAEARDRPDAALASYRRLRAAEPRLGAWADLNIARIEHHWPLPEASTPVTHESWLREDAVSPTGVPVAVLACVAAAESAKPESAAVERLVKDTLENLRRGTWWLSFEERSSYDSELVTMLRNVTRSDPAREERDPRLGELAAIEQPVRASPPGRGGANRRSYESTPSGAFLLAWTAGGSEPDPWRGVAIRDADVAGWLAPVLDPLF